MDTEKPKELPSDFWTAPIDVDPLADYEPHGGAEIEEVVPFNENLETIVQQMWKDMTEETKILQGTLEVEYTIEGEFVIPESVAKGSIYWKEKENELSEEKNTEE
jgi:hypothetical protein